MSIDNSLIGGNTYGLHESILDYYTTTSASLTFFSNCVSTACKYYEARFHHIILSFAVTTCPQATSALTMLRENRRGFDVVISNVHMPDMDGFRFLELVGLEMDLPFINTVMKGIKHGACDYLIKPVRMEELRNIWQHVVRKRFSESREHEHSGSIVDTDRNRLTNNDNEASSANDVGDGSWKSQKKKRDKEEDEGDENGDPSASKKSSVVWSIELHQQFVNAVNHLGIDKAVTKKILELMNVPGLTRESIASHSQEINWAEIEVPSKVVHSTSDPRNKDLKALDHLYSIQRYFQSGEGSSEDVVTMNNEYLQKDPQEIPGEKCFISNAFDVLTADDLPCTPHGFWKKDDPGHICLPQGAST
ncbi:hypothetical protein EJB05_00862 [Eragrostis curvula]|uniref:Response regulatory domain-containing protein n=1 Tax=Eragrostis curvula TaxID=38414 RepID=A0A5J9WMY9_9POAL|nr:hypothetical protein EJB05_00862 [Eragrostis curvula]